MMRLESICMYKCESRSRAKSEVRSAKCDSPKHARARWTALRTPDFELHFALGTSGLRTYTRCITTVSNQLRRIRSPTSPDFSG